MAKSLRISLVTETYFPQVNGVSRTLDRLVRYCSEQGDRVQLLLPRYDENSVQLPSRVEKCEWRSVALPFYKEVVLPMVTVGRVENTLSRFRPDLVHIATEGPLGWAALRAAKRLQLPVVSSYHTNFPHYLQTYHASFLEPLSWRYLRWFHNSTLATFCPSASSRTLIEDKGFRNVGIWSRGVDKHRFNPGKRDHDLRRSLGINPDDLLMTYDGRIANEKNLDMLVEAWRRLSEHQDCHLLFVGDGPLRARLESMNIPRTIFAGYRYGEELASIYASSDLFVFPSLSETFGNVVLEAKASGLPVVAYNVQGPKDIVRDHHTGLLVDDITPQALAIAIKEMVDNRELMKQMGRQARAYAEGCTWEKIMGELRNQYEEFTHTSQPEAAWRARAKGSIA